MIEAAATKDVIHGTAGVLRPAEGGDFRALLEHGKAPDAAAAGYQWQGPVAQYLLGIGEDDGEGRQKVQQRVARPAMSISELSGLPIAQRPAAAMPDKAVGGPAQKRGTGAARQPSPDVQRHEVRPGVGSSTESRLNGGEAGSSTQRSEVPADARQGEQRGAPGAETQRSSGTVQAKAARATGNAVALPQGGVRGASGAAARESTAPQGVQRGDAAAGARQGGGQRAGGGQMMAFRPASLNSARAADGEQETRFAAQLSRGLAAALRQNGGSVTMRLQPESLGDVKIRVDHQPGRIGAVFEVSSEPARELLNQNLTLLRTALEARGMDVEWLDVRLAEPAERGTEGQGRSATDGDKDERTGGAGTQDGQRRWNAPPDASAGGVGGKDRSPGDREGHAPEALPEIHAALRVWQQAAEMGGAQVWRTRLDAIA